MKKIKTVLILLILINIGILIYLLATPTVKQYDYTSYAIKQEDNNKENTVQESTSSDKTIIQFENENILLSNYMGQLATGNVNVKFTNLINGGFAKLYKDTVGMNIYELKNYLETNKVDIKTQTGITGITTFSEFLEGIQIYENPDIKCTKAEIVEGSYSNGNEYDNFQVKLTYDNGQTALFVVMISNKEFMDTPAIIIK